MDDVHFPDWGAFRVKLMGTIDRKTAKYMAVYFKCPLADIGMINEAIDPGFKFVTMAETKGIITSTNINKIIQALRRISHHQAAGIVQNLFETLMKHPSVHLKVADPKYNRQDYPYLHDDDIYSIDEEDDLRVMNKFRKKLFNKLLQNYTLSINYDFKPLTNVGKLRIAVIGKTGGGKSATANTILGNHLFNDDYSPRSATATSSRQMGIFEDRHIDVVDTPGLQDAHRRDEFVLNEISRISVLLEKGVHAFVFVFNASCPRFSKEDLTVLDQLRETFGADFIKYCLVVFTRAESVLNRISLDELIEEQKKDDNFGSFLRSIDWRIVAVNNNCSAPAEIDRNQRSIIALIDRMVITRRYKKESEFYTNELFAKLEKAKSSIRESLILNGLGEEMYDAIERSYSSASDVCTQDDELVGDVRKRLPVEYYQQLQYAIVKAKEISILTPTMHQFPRFFQEMRAAPLEEPVETKQSQFLFRPDDVLESILQEQAILGRRQHEYVSKNGVRWLRDRWPFELTYHSKWVCVIS